MKYHNITHDDMLNGDGLRVVLWISGCEHRCKYCHNPDTWDIDSGIEFDESAKNEIFNSLKNDYIKGITLTGGDPLHKKNRYDVEKFIKEIKNVFVDKDIWLYTGYIWEDILDLELIKYVDVIADGKFDKNLMSTELKYIGSENQRIIDVNLSLRKNTVILKNI